MRTAGFFDGANKTKLTNIWQERQVGTYKASLLQRILRTFIHVSDTMTAITDRRLMYSTTGSFSGCRSPAMLHLDLFLQQHLHRSAHLSLAKHRYYSTPRLIQPLPGIRSGVLAGFWKVSLRWSDCIHWVDVHHQTPLTSHLLCMPVTVCQFPIQTV